MKKTIVVLDACVLIPMPLCDTLLRAAEASLYRFHTSEQILEETARNLAKILGKRNKLEPKIAEEKAQKRVRQMKQAFPESLIEPKEEIIIVLKNDPKDRHVLAAAIEAKADTIVTSNRSDFPTHTLEPYKIKAVSPDEFLVELVEFNGEVKLVNILQQQADDIDLNLDILLDKLRQNGANNFRGCLKSLYLALWLKLIFSTLDESFLLRNKLFLPDFTKYFSLDAQVILITKGSG